MSDQKLPWFKFHTLDWRSDQCLRRCGFAAQGLWIGMLALMHEASPYGELRAGSHPLDARDLAKILGGKFKEIENLLKELEKNFVFSRDKNGVIYSRRMKRDYEKSLKDKENGKKGGNPWVNPPLNPPDNPGDKARVRVQKEEEEDIKDSDLNPRVRSNVHVLPSSVQHVVESLTIALEGNAKGQPFRTLKPNPRTADLQLAILKPKVLDRCPLTPQQIAAIRKARA